MWNPGNVVMLATNKKATAPIFKRDAHLYIGYGEKLEYKNRDNSYQHLYITSYEEIKEGDWIRDSIGSIRQADSLELKSNYPKIIATTDTHLCINIGGDILPLIPQSFIIYFIAEYNKGNVIDKVMVEYEYMVWDKPLTRGNSHITPSLKLKLNPDNTINIKLIKDSWNKEELPLVAMLNLIGYIDTPMGRKLQHPYIVSEVQELKKWIKYNLR